MAKKYNVSICYLLGDTDHDNKCLNITDPEAKGFIKDILNAAKEEREELKRYWEFVKQKREE